MNTPFVYVIHHPDYGAVKIGQSSVRSTRLAMFGKAGWVRYRELHLASLPTAYEIEQAALFDLRHRLHLPEYLAANQLPGGGWTETVSAALAPPTMVWETVCTEASRILMGHGRPDVRARQSRPRTSWKSHTDSLAEADLNAARKLYDDDPIGFSTPRVARLIGRSNNYAKRIRDAIKNSKEDQ